jgi:hypothetical protein
MQTVNNMLSDSWSCPQIIVIHFEHKMDVIKVEPNSDSEDDLLSSHHGQLINTNMAFLPLALHAFKAKNLVSISG